MTSRTKLIFQLFAITALSIAIAFVSRNGFAWTNPASAPPSGSSVLKVVSGNVGIGIASPSKKLDVSGDAQVSGVLSSGKIQLIDTVTEGASCSPTGLVARDSTGLLLSCQSGVWKKASGAATITDTWGSCYLTYADLAASCGGGYYLVAMDRFACSNVPGATDMSHCWAKCCRVR